MTATQFKTLEPYEKHFATAANSYIHGIYHSDITLLEPIYTQLGFRLDNVNCADCILTMFKRLGKAYNEYHRRVEARSESTNKVKKDKSNGGKTEKK